MKFITKKTTDTGRVRFYLGGENGLRLFSYKPAHSQEQLQQLKEKLESKCNFLLTIDSIFTAQSKDPNFVPDIYHYNADNSLGMFSCLNKKDVEAVLQNNNLLSAYKLGSKIPRFVVVHGMNNPIDSEIAVYAAKSHNIPLFFNEDGFLKSATTYVAQCDPLYTRPVSFTFDPFGAYFDCTNHSLLERWLNDFELELDESQKERAQKCIKYILDNHLTKYNHQPIDDHILDHISGSKVLVVDQSYGDMSITRGGANENTFKEMLERAIKDNPDSTVLVKTHPDAICSSKVKAYYAGLKENAKLKLLTAPVNPISLIKQCDRIYVCTSQFGFEAMMCGKDVHIFGRPFYAGYGIGHSYQNMNRLRTRTLEEIFYLSYIRYTHYLNPFTNQPCEIEEAMECLIKLREKYLKEQGHK